MQAETGAATLSKTCADAAKYEHKHGRITYNFNMQSHRASAQSTHADAPALTPALLVDRVGVINGSRANVSFAVGMMLDQFDYQLPLYRQHRRLGDAGFKVGRASSGKMKTTYFCLSLTAGRHARPFDI